MTDRKNPQLFNNDTCGCIVHEYAYPDNPEKPHELLEYLVKCDRHNDHPDFDNGINTELEAYEAMVKENQMKNNVINHLISENVLPMSMTTNIPVYDEKTRTKRIERILRENIIYKFYYTGKTHKERKINFSFEGLDANENVINLGQQHKAAISGILDKHFGSDKHAIHDHILEETHPEFAKLNNEMIEKSKKYAASYKLWVEEREKGMSRIDSIKKIFTTS